MRDLQPIFDGAQGSVRRFTLKDAAAELHDLSTMAVQIKVRDAVTRTTIATLPGICLGTKADGIVDVYIKGRETDWDGAGRELILIPKFYFATAPDRTPATNILANPSFDTGAGTVADSWTVGSVLGDMIYSINQDDPAPPVIFGKCQRSYAAIGSTTTAYLTQSPAGAVVAGDYFSCGVWYRASVAAGGSVVGSEHYMTLLGGANVLKTNFPVGDTDWTFVYAEKRATDAAANSSFALVNLDAKGYEIRYDDAFLFKGRWIIRTGEFLRLPVERRLRPSKTNFITANFIAGFGGFEVDSDANGVADAWTRFGSTNTYSMEYDPDHLDTSVVGAGRSKGAQKVALASSSSDGLRLIYRGHFKAGERWRFDVKYKNSGALTGSPANGDFGIVIHTEAFDGTYETSSLLGANFNLTSVAAYATKFRELTLSEDHSVLVLDINLKTAGGGTLWLEDARLFRTL